MQILKQSREFTKKEIFKMANDNHKLMKNVPDDTKFHMVDYVRYRSDDDKEIAIIFTVTPDSELETVATNSPTVMKTIESAMEFMETSDLEFILKRAVSKSGRTFMNVELY